MTTGSPRRGGPPRPDSAAAPAAPAAASTDVSSREEEEEEAKLWKSLNEALRRKLVDVDEADLKPFKCVDDVIAFFDWMYIRK